MIIAPTQDVTKFKETCLIGICVVKIQLEGIHHSHLKCLFNKNDVGNTKSVLHYSQYSGNIDILEVPSNQILSMNDSGCY